MPRKNYSKGAKKALSRMKSTYGAKKGTSIFYAKAREHGKSPSTYYKKGGKQGSPRKRRK